MLEICNLVKKFGPVVAVDNVSFSVPAGEVLGFLGPNGAGKSTTMKMITGFLAPTEGRIEYEGTPLTKLREYEIYRLGIGRKFQTPIVYSDHTVFENILMGLEGSRGVWPSIFGRVPLPNRGIVSYSLSLPCTLACFLEQLTA